MPAYAVFAAVTGVVVTAFVVLAALSARSVPAALADGESGFTPGLLAGNVVATHGIAGAVVLLAARYAELPWSDLGMGAVSPAAIATGLVVGGILAVANEAGQRALDRVGMEADETLRGLLTPGTRAGWVVLLGLALPVVAAVEELVFRAALIGAVAAGFGLPVWGLAVVSSVAFGLGHGIQGAGGVVVTGTLGFALAATFVVTGSLPIVVTAHYVVNAVEFIAHPDG